MEGRERSGGSSSGGPRRFAGPRPFQASPVRVGDEYDVRIDSMSRRGDSGVARIQGLVVFVTGARAGDSVRIKIANVGKGYASAQVVGKAGEQQSKDSLQAKEEGEEAEASGDSGE